MHVDANCLSVSALGGPCEVGLDLKCPFARRNGHLRLDEIALRYGENPRQQIVDAVDRVIGDLFEHAAEV